RVRRFSYSAGGPCRDRLCHSQSFTPREFGEGLSPGLTLPHGPAAGRRTVGRILPNAVAVAGVWMPRNVSTRNESRGGGGRKPRDRRARNARERPGRRFPRKRTQGARGRSREVSGADRTQR